MQFECTGVARAPGDRLVPYAHGLMESRDDPGDERLEELLTLPANAGPLGGEDLRPAAAELRGADAHDDVAPLIARADPGRRPGGGPDRVPPGGW